MAYATLAELRAYLELEDGSYTSEDDLLTNFIGIAQQAIDLWTGTTFEWAGAAEDRQFDSYRDVSGLTLFLSRDATDITAVENGDGSTIGSTLYTVWPPNDPPYREIRLRRSAGVVWRPSGNGDSEDAITVTGKWAYSETADALIKHCTIRLAAWLYRQRGAQGGSDQIITSQDGTKVYPSRLPSDIEQLLKPYKRRGNSL